METIFSFFAMLTERVGIDANWLNAAAVNVMMLTGMVRDRYPDKVKGFWATTGVVCGLTAILAVGVYYTNPVAIPVAIFAVWFGTTFAMKAVNKSADTVKPRGTMDRGPSKPGA